MHARQIPVVPTSHNRHQNLLFEKPKYLPSPTDVTFDRDQALPGAVHGPVSLEALHFGRKGRCSILDATFRGNYRGKDWTGEC
jgi:hypothetical protein